jgi:hypothetical protein
LLEIIAEQGGGDFRIGSHWVTTEGIGKVTKSELEVIDGSEDE